MKSKLKLPAFFLTFVVLLTCLAACGGQKNVISTSGDKPAANEPIISIEDIAWSVGEPVLDGTRRVAMTYTNNSPYSIIRLEMTFREKEGITEEQRAAYVKDLTEYLSLDESKENDRKQIEQLKAQEIGMNTDSDLMVAPGESEPAAPLHYYGGITYVEKLDHYQYVTPDIATIEYIADGSIYTVYYDYVAEQYTLDTDKEVAYDWPDNPLSDLLPKPEAEYLENNWDYEDSYSFEVYGYTYEAYTNYLEQCKQSGFTRDVSETDDRYSAKNAAGNELEVRYDEDDRSMRVEIEKP